MNGRDLGSEMVSAGWAVAFTRYDRRYVAVESRARGLGIGLWSMSFELPQDFRAASRAAAAAAPPPPHARCAIKGNVNAEGARIYHLPGSRAYPEVRIDVARGERWFCGEAEARAAGWRGIR